MHWNATDVSKDAFWIDNGSFQVSSSRREGLWLPRASRSGVIITRPSGPSQKEKRRGQRQVQWGWVFIVTSVERCFCSDEEMKTFPFLTKSTTERTTKRGPLGRGERETDGCGARDRRGGYKRRLRRGQFVVCLLRNRHMLWRSLVRIEK